MSTPYSTPALTELLQLGIDSLWYNLGPHLQIPVDRLEIIKKDNPFNTVGCSIQMFTFWLNNDSKASYMKLLQALVSMGGAKIAARICQKKCFSSDVMNTLLPGESHHSTKNEDSKSNQSSDGGNGALRFAPPSLLPNNFPPVIEASNLVVKGKQCFKAAQSVLDSPEDDEAKAHLRELQADGLILVDNAIHAKGACEAQIYILQGKIDQLCLDVEKCKKHIEELEQMECDTDTTMLGKQEEAEFQRCELEREQVEIEAAEAEESYQRAQKKAAKSQLIGAALGALVTAFTDDDSWTIAGSAIGSVVAEIDGKIQKKRKKVEECKAALENAEKAVTDARSSLGKIRGKIEEYKYKIAQNYKEIDNINNTIEAIERVVTLHKKSAMFWGMFSAATTASLDSGSDLLSQVVKSAEEVVDTEIVASQVLTIAKPFLEIWELLALIDLKDFF